MFFYIYDQFVLDKKHHGTLTRVENRIIELGINGRIEKLAPLRNIKEVISLALKQDAHTIVVVGTDETFIRAVNLLATEHVSLGYIPVAQQSVIAKLLGIQDTMEACNVLSRRITKMIDLMKVNSQYALTGAHISSSSDNVRIVCDDKFTVSFPRNTVHIRFDNLGPVLQTTELERVVLPAQKKQLWLDVRDTSTSKGWFNRNTSPEEAKRTRLPFKQLRVEHSTQENTEPATIEIDGLVTLKTPLTISFRPKQLKVIVGKQRLIG